MGPNISNLRIKCHDLILNVHELHPWVAHHPVPRCERFEIFGLKLIDPLWHYLNLSFRKFDGPNALLLLVAHRPHVGGRG